MTMFFLEVLGKNPFACLFQLLEAVHILWFMTSASISPPFLTLTFLPHSDKDLVITLDPSGNPG